MENLQASISYYMERLGFQRDFEGPDDDLWGFEVKDTDGYVLAIARVRDQ